MSQLVNVPVVVSGGDLIFEKSKHTCVGFSTNKVYMLGEKYSGIKPRGPLQHFQQLKSECLAKGSLFEDPQFQPHQIDVGSKWDRHLEKIQWLRPKDIVPSPRMISGAPNRFDINQGDIGDCWFLAALTNITQNHELMEFIVPLKQDFDQEYAGIFHFRFWQYGRWIDIVIDDRLPTYDGKLIFSKSKEPDEFWTPLLEKAYAKLYGSYKSLEGGFISEALQDLTGGLSEIHQDLQRKADSTNYFEMMLSLLVHNSFMGCGIMNSSEMEGKRDDGLYTLHAYSITDVVEVNCKFGNLYRLLRLRNPWGFGEWNGKWSDNSESWNLLSEELRSTLQTKKSDGEFWMQYEDFIKAFDLLEFCHITHWRSYMTDGSWARGISNGGLPTSINFYRNPQYLLAVAGPEKNRNYRVLVGLMQKHRRDSGLPPVPIGLKIYTMTDVPEVGRLKQDFFLAKKPVCDVRTDNAIQVTGHAYLPNGTYCVIPYVEDNRINCEFLLRFYADTEFTIRELDEEVKVLQGNLMSRSVDSRQADTAMKTLFRSFAGDDEQISWQELKSILDLLMKSEKHELSRDVCRSMLALADNDISGKLNFQEFFQLWEDIGKWRGIFRLYDSDATNTLSASELREALRDVNIRVNNRILNILLLRYGNEKGQLDMEDFLHCCIKLNLTIFIHETKYKDKMSLEDWIVDSIYA